MLTAEITEPEYRREYQVVQRELEMDKGNPDFVFALMTNINRYRVSPERVPVIGFQEVIQGLKVDDVRGYYHLAYQPNNLVFVVAGSLDPELMLQAVQKNVADAKPGRVFPHDITPEPQVLAPRTFVATFPKLGSARLELGYPTVRLDDPDLYALDLLSVIFAQGESSILVQRLRDQLQLVTDISAGDNTPSYVTGTFAIECSATPRSPAVKSRRACRDREVEGVRRSMRIGSPGERADARAARRSAADRRIHRRTIATDYFQTGDAHFQDHYIERIQNVTSAELTAAAKKYLDPQRLLTTALLPSEAAGNSELPKAEDLFRARRPRPTSRRPTAPSDQSVTRCAVQRHVVLHKRLSTAPLVSIKLYCQRRRERRKCNQQWHRQSGDEARHARHANSLGPANRRVLRLHRRDDLRPCGNNSGTGTPRASRKMSIKPSRHSPMS